MAPDWPRRAVTTLLALREPAGAWGYRHGSDPCVEPTALAAMSLRASGHPCDPDLIRVADWLTRVQRPDGSLGLSETRSTPCWMTPYAILLWKALELHEASARRACDWLLGQKGRVLPRSDDPGGVAGHDTTLVGWPWVEDTHSWLEPTALAVLALGRCGYGEHPRVMEGLTLIRNRAVSGGGWNYGNRAVFGRPLRPQPAPTGLALLTLSTIDKRTPLVERALAYLVETLPRVRAPSSLGWGVLGLRAWGCVPSEAAVWLAESFAAVEGRNDAAPKVAPLLLAAQPGSLEAFGRGRSDSGGTNA